jgi:hypothetical protein
MRLKEKKQTQVAHAQVVSRTELAKSQKTRVFLGPRCYAFVNQYKLLAIREREMPVWIVISFDVKTVLPSGFESLSSPKDRDADQSKQEKNCSPR